MSLCLSASAAPLETGAFVPRPTPIARLRQLFGGETAAVDRHEAIDPTDTIAQPSRASVNVLLL